VIKLRNVSKRYGERGFALRNVSLQINKGEFAFLTGHSGSGKSTALRLVHMAEDPTEGEIVVAGFRSNTMHRRELWKVRRKVGFVFQDFRLLPDRTAMENIAFVLRVMDTPRRKIGPMAQRLLAGVGLATKAGALVHELSGGERQRVGIARALAGDPHVLLADEPTGNLDEAASRGVMELFRRSNAGGTTVLMATHDLAIVRSMPGTRCFELEHGQLSPGPGSETQASLGATEDTRQRRERHQTGSRFGVD